MLFGEEMGRPPAGFISKILSPFKGPALDHELLENQVMTAAHCGDTVGPHCSVGGVVRGVSV